MAEKENAEQAPDEQPSQAGGKSRMKSILMIAGFAVGQVLLVLVVVWVMHGSKQTPHQASAAGAETTPQTAEISVLPNDERGVIKAVNAKSGQVVYWTLKVDLRVPKEQMGYLRERLVENESYIKQEINTIVGAADPVILTREADHATLKRQIRYALNKILGKGTIDEVLIPECIPATLD